MSHGLVWREKSLACTYVRLLYMSDKVACSLGLQCACMSRCKDSHIYGMYEEIQRTSKHRGACTVYMHTCR